MSVTTNPIKRYYDASEYLYKEKFLIKKFSNDMLKITNYLANKNAKVVFLITPSFVTFKKWPGSTFEIFLLPVLLLGIHKCLK